MQDVLIFVPASNQEEAKQYATDLIKQKLAFVVRITKDVYQLWLENGGIGSDTITVLRIRTAKNLIDKVKQYFANNHKWGKNNYCFEVIELNVESKMPM